MPIFAIVAAEDALLAAIAKRLLAEFGDKYVVTGQIKTTSGHSEIDKKARKWNQSARYGNVHFVLRDMDSLAPPENSDKCPQSEIIRLLDGAEKHPRFLFRFAVAESENWLLADFNNLLKFLDVKQLPPPSPDSIKDGKEYLLRIAAQSRNKVMREGLTRDNATKPGMLWNDKLTEFVRDKWNPAAAAKNSKSLRRTLARLKEFRPPAD